MSSQLFEKDFIDAFNHAMLYEVGPHWDPTKPDVIAGKIGNKQQRRDVGYVNDPDDTGGETKFGIAKNANPSVDIKNLTLEGAMVIYYNKYWLEPNCNSMPAPINLIHFDGCINHGSTRANKFIQKVVGAEPDGKIGARTLKLIREADAKKVVIGIADLREQFYLDIIKRKPSQEKFKNGWLRRISEIKEYCLKRLK